MTDRLEQLETRWENDPESRIFLQLAEEYRRGGRAQDSIPVLEKGLEHHGNWIGAQVCLGRCRLETGNAVGAAACLEAVVRKDPTQLMAYRLLVEAYIELGDAASASDRLQLYDELNEGDPEVEVLRERVAALGPGDAAPDVADPAEADATVITSLDDEDTAPDVPVIEVAELASPATETSTLEAVPLVDEEPALATVDDSYALDQPVSAEFEAPLALEAEPEGQRAPAASDLEDDLDQDGLADETMEMPPDAFGEAVALSETVAEEVAMVSDAPPLELELAESDTSGGDEEPVGVSDWRHTDVDDFESVVETGEAANDYEEHVPAPAVAAAGGPVPAADDDGPLVLVPRAAPPVDLVSVLSAGPPRVLRARQRRSVGIPSSELPEAPEVPEPAAVDLEEAATDDPVAAPLPFKPSSAEVPSTPPGDVQDGSGLEALRLSGSMPALDLGPTTSDDVDAVEGSLSPTAGLLGEDEVDHFPLPGLSTLGPTSVDVRETGAMSVRELVGEATIPGDSEVEKKSHVLKSYLDRLQSKSSSQDED